MNLAKSKAWVDSQFHVFQAHVGTSGARYVPGYDARLSQWQALALPLGVSQGVLVQPSFLGTDNRLMLACLDAHPRALRGVAVVAPGTPRPALEKLHAQGVRGIRLNLSGCPHDLSAWGRDAAMWHGVQALGWHLEVHTDRGMLSEVLAHLPQDLPLVIDHMGKPASVSAQDPTVLALAARSRRSAVHVKLSGAYRLEGLDAGALARLWLSELGPDRLLWGSDWPCTNHESQADYARLLGSLSEWVGEDAAQAALGTNPQALYWGC